MKNEQIKIWGTSYGVLGDLIMGLPLLQYFDKKYPDSYKYWVIQGKVSLCAPIYFNHPLIDRIKITDHYHDFGENDKRLMSDCHFVCNATSNHEVRDWYNYRDCVTETAHLAGIKDMHEVLSEEEMIPKLVPWFTPGFENPQTTTYSKNDGIDNSGLHRSVGIWPFAAQTIQGRSPSPKWWNVVVENLINRGFNVIHFGKSNEPNLSNSAGYHRVGNMSFFQQVKAALATSITIGPDTGPMWIMGAYSHKSINLVTNYLPGHLEENVFNITPVNRNAVNIFSPINRGVGCNGIDILKVLETVEKNVL